jgi:hypothetical protein
MNAAEYTLTSGKSQENQLIIRLPRVSESNEQTRAAQRNLFLRLTCYLTYNKQTRENFNLTSLVQRAIFPTNVFE